MINFMNLSYDAVKLTDAVDRFSEVNVLVVGDVMLDEFVWGTVDRISPEAPVPVVEVTEETQLLGGAANVINNIVSAGGRTRLAGVIGLDDPGKKIVEMIKHLGVDPLGMIIDATRPTTIKTRVVAHAQQVVRIDREKKLALEAKSREDLFTYLADIANEVDAVIIADYGKGVITQDLMDRVREIYLGLNKIIAVDPKVNNFKLYEKVTVMTPNHHEAGLGAGFKIDSEETLLKAGQKLLDELACRSVLVTQGERGMTLFERANESRHIPIPTVAREVFDVTGAGDTVIAIMTLGLASGLNFSDAAILSNFAAGVVVGEVGTSTVTAERLKDRVLAGARGFNGCGF